jgi:(p)ppGpp synthase/HD superfamily hydrolase
MTEIYCKLTVDLIDQLMKKLDGRQNNIPLIEKGIDYCIKWHAGQRRKSGEWYHTHPIQVASYVADYPAKDDTLVAALLHDTLEDTLLTVEEIDREFSSRTGEIVLRLTRIIVEGKKLKAGECLEKAFDIEDKEAILIKLCDRKHNLETIDAMSEEGKQKIIQETGAYFIPLAMYYGFKDLENDLAVLCYNIKNAKLGLPKKRWIEEIVCPLLFEDSFQKAVQVLRNVLPLNRTEW